MDSFQNFSSNKKPNSSSTIYDIDGYDITPKPKPIGKPYVSIPSYYEPKISYK